MDLREIDRLVAEKVMGCEEATSIWFDDYDKTKKYYCISDTPDKEISIIEYVNKGWVQYLFHPSEIIADAWQVVEELSKDGFDFQIWCEKGKYNVEFAKDFFYLFGFAESETAPLAISLAALKAVGVEVEVNK